LGQKVLAKVVVVWGKGRDNVDTRKIRVLWARPDVKSCGAKKAGWL